MKQLITQNTITMAFETDLPVGSTRLAQWNYKDPNNKVWTGVDGEYYRFLDPTDLSYINIKDFGAVGDGVTDDTAAWDEALSVAKANEMALYFPSGQYPITVAVDSVDMNGCLGLTGNGELLFSESGDPDAPLLEWSGSKTRIASNVSVAFGQNAFTVNTGLTISRGDTIFMVSNNAFYTDLTDVAYVKGNRFTADSYNPATGELIVYEYASFAVTDAFLYHNTRQMVLISDVTITLSSDPDKKGIQLTASEGYVRGLKMNGFGRFGLNVSSSFARINDTIILSPDYQSNGTNYGLESSGLSDTIAFNSIFFGGRHAVACGDVGYWRSDDVDVAGNTPFFLPSILKLSGCRIEGKLFGLDSHSGTILLEAYNCDIYGGCLLSGLENFVTSCRVHQGGAAAAFRFGSGRVTDSGQFQSKHSVRNCEIYASTCFALVANDMERIELDNVNVYATSSVSVRNFLQLSSNSQVRNWIIRGINHIGNSGDDVTYNVYLANPVVIESCNLEQAKFLISARTATVRDIYIKDTRVKTGNGVAISVGFSGLSGGNKTFNLHASGVTVYDSPYAINSNGAKRITVSSSALRGNTTTVNIISTAGGDVELMMNGNTIEQTSGNVIAAGQVTQTVLIGNIFNGSAAFSANAVINAKYGNIGLNDKLKTTLTTVTVTKYGSDTTTGDLTLS